LPVPSRLVVLQELPRLASGKIDRVTLASKAKDLMQLGNSKADPVDALELQLVRIWEKVLAVEAVATTDDFFALGGDSLAAATMLAAVEKFCGVGLPTSSLLEATTVQKLADLIRLGGLGEIDLRLVALRLRGNKPPLYCVPGAGADALQFRILARYLPDDQPIFAFQPRGFGGRSPHLRSVEEMAKSYIDALHQHQPRGPYFLCGASFGGVVAFEMARRLTVDGDEVRMLALLDSYGGEYPKRRKDLSLRNKLEILVLRSRPPVKRGRVLSRHFLKTLLSLRTLLRLKTLLRFSADLSVRCAYGFHGWCQRHLIDLDLRWNFERLPGRLRYIYLQEVGLAARRRYELKPFSGKIDVFRAEHQPPRDLFEEDPLLGWSGMAAGGIEVHQFPGDHTMYLREPVIAAVVAAQLGACLEQASGKGR
jgi:thioesterase domain-containing protein/acyl carrier protein